MRSGRKRETRRRRIVGSRSRTSFLIAGSAIATLLTPLRAFRRRTLGRGEAAVRNVDDLRRCRYARRSPRRHTRVLARLATGVGKSLRDAKSLTKLDGLTSKKAAASLVPNRDSSRGQTGARCSLALWMTIALKRPRLSTRPSTQSDHGAAAPQPCTSSPT